LSKGIFFTVLLDIYVMAHGNTDTYHRLNVIHTKNM
jgi:hypothetical protein